MAAGALLAAVIAAFASLGGWKFWRSRKDAKGQFTYRGVFVDLSQLSRSQISAIGDMPACGIDTACERTSFETIGLGFKVEFVPTRTFAAGSDTVHGLTFPSSRRSICGLHGTDGENASIVCHELTHQILWAKNIPDHGHSDRALWSLVDSPVDVEKWRREHGRG